MVKVPGKTTAYKIEPHPEKYVIGFAPELIKFILNGQKVKTYRYGFKYDYLTPGDMVTIENTVSKEVIGKAQVKSKKKTTFENLPVEEGGHETYDAKEHQRKVLSGYYAYLGRPIKNDDPFLIFEFQLIK